MCVCFECQETTPASFQLTGICCSSGCKWQRGIRCRDRDGFVWIRSSISLDHTKSTAKRDSQSLYPAYWNTSQKCYRCKCLHLSVLDTVAILWINKGKVFFSCESLRMELCSKMRTKQSWLQKYLQLVWSASMFLILKNALTGTTFQSRSHWRAGRVELADTHKNTHAHTHIYIHTWTNKTDLCRSVVSLDIPGCLSLTLPTPLHQALDGEEDRIWLCCYFSIRFSITRWSELKL